MIVDHIGIAVRKIEDALPLYIDILGGKLEDRYTSEVPGVEVHVAVIKMADKTIELLEPTNDKSPIATFIKLRGKGVHHVAYRVDDLDSAIHESRQKGIRFLEETLRVNSRGRRLIYMNPASTNGTIIELCDYPFKK
ncbi:methylmalonyl-CoA epimerase [Neobacillus endophyticus]|uniref:methylmalonyl-CoA epimerase n=1 Tax=Neobacillus endophyticus TaxID=2738405 RepID=UPI001FE8BAE9|nr:methylmalonyl-CoA epimerase [Neobacillus endophyticus]